MYGIIRTDVESTDGYYIIQRTSEMFTLQVNKEMEDYKPTITAYEGEIACDDIFLNPVPNIKYWFTPMNKEVCDVTVRLNTSITTQYNNDEDR